jgi:hypothetical protein
MLRITPDEKNFNVENVSLVKTENREIDVRAIIKGKYRNVHKRTYTFLLKNGGENINQLRCFLVYSKPTPMCCCDERLNVVRFSSVSFMTFKRTVVRNQR